MELPLTAQLFIVNVPPLKTPPASFTAEFPLITQLDNAAFPRLLKPPPPFAVALLPSVIVSPDSAADAPELIANTPLALLPLIDNRFAPGPAIVVTAVSVKVSAPAIHPGDLVFVEVWSTSPTAGTALIFNVSTMSGASYSLTEPKGTTLKGNSVEWIVESPSVGSGNRESFPGSESRAIREFLCRDSFAPLELHEIESQGCLPAADDVIHI